MLRGGRIGSYTQLSINVLEMLRMVMNRYVMTVI